MFKEKEYSRLRETLFIDEMSIETELFEHPANLLEASEFTAASINARDKAEFDLSATKAEAARRLRNKGDKKLAETAIATAILLEEDVEDAHAEFLEAKGDAQLWTALVESLKAKTSALKHIAELVTSGYLTSGNITKSRHAELRKDRPTVKQTLERRKLRKSE